ncbi:MAG: type II toxin-antitoxin system VapC family toxin [Candidatus Omnitrophica bacterium]|nr:type II toxin-antitoxin system VapC family toxin [Candidatus Omnitrophota bacterium]
MNFVSDTHSLIWYFTDDPRLGKAALKAFEDTVRKGKVIVPSIVLAEIMHISKRGKIGLSFQKTLELIEEISNFQISSLDSGILKTADSIKTDLEMHDRLIVATAIWYKYPLVTLDEGIVKSKLVKTIW